MAVTHSTHIVYVFVELATHFHMRICPHA